MSEQPLSQAILAWHFLPDDGRLRYGDRAPVAVGQTLRAEGDLILCRNGMHASRRAIDALGYASGSLLCRVRMGGEVVEEEGGDKLVARERTVLWMGDATRILHAFACWVAEDTLDALAARGCDVDPRARRAIAVKRLWLDRKASDGDLAAATAAGWAAARDAATDAAWAAAWAAATAAARDAAWAAARGAAWAAVRAAAIERYNTELEKRLTEAFAPADGEGATR
jgi:hypothetical protein